MQNNGNRNLANEFGRQNDLPVAAPVVANPEFRLIDRPGRPDFPAFYDLYEKIFILPEVRQSPEGFNRILGYNGNQALQEKFGPFLESMLIMVDPANGKLMGAVNFLRGARRPEHDRAAWGNIDAFNQNTYVFVNPEYRGQGVAGRLLDKANDMTAAWAREKFASAGMSVPAKINVVDMFEQDDPLQLTPAAYVKDSRAAGMSQETRLIIFQRMGARTLSDPARTFKYAQAPIFEPGTPPDERPGAADYLMLTTRVPDGAKITARFLREGYIPAYFAAWYTGGTGNLEEIADYRRMMGELAQDRTFDTRNDLKNLPALETITGNALAALDSRGQLER